MIASSPLLSIITVCLNEPNLEKTCESIVAQTYQDFEWIVIDGGSNDETLAIFEKYKSRMDYFVSKPDYGIYCGMNKGILQASGEWLNFMNAGDMFADNEVLQNISNDHSKFDYIDVLYGTADWGKNKLFTAPAQLDKTYFYSIPLPHQASFIRRTACWKYDTSYKFAADQRLFITMYEAGAAFSPLDCVVCVQAENGISSRMLCSEQKINERNRIKRNASLRRSNGRLKLDSPSFIGNLREKKRKFS